MIKYRLFSFWLTDMLFYVNECILNYKYKWNNFNVVCYLRLRKDKKLEGYRKCLILSTSLSKSCVFSAKKERKRNDTSLKHSVIWTEIIFSL